MFRSVFNDKKVVLPSLTNFPKLPTAEAVTSSTREILDKIPARRGVAPSAPGVAPSAPEAVAGVAAADEMPAQTGDTGAEGAAGAGQNDLPPAGEGGALGDA